MTAVVRLYRNAAEEYGRDLFACSPEEWRFFQELGHTFGWRPRGTTYELPAGSKREGVALRNYDSGTADDRKLVTAEDAVEWARALETAQRSAHFTAMVEARFGTASGLQTIADALAEFIQYAFGGAFTFALANATAAPQ